EHHGNGKADVIALATGVENQVAKNEQDEDIGQREDEAAANQGKQKIAFAHRSGEEPLEELANAHIDDDKAHTPQAAAHQPQAYHAGQKKIDVARAGLLQMLYVGRLRTGLPRLKQRCFNGIASDAAFGAMRFVPKTVGKRTARRADFNDEVGLARLEPLL